MENLSILQQATKFVLANSVAPPEPQAVVEALLQAEKAARLAQNSCNYSQLAGTWRLCLVTGTKKARAKAGIVLGAARYVPQWLKIQLSYSLAPELASDRGRIENWVQFGALELVLAGPTKLLPKRNILAFDFTRLTVKLFGKLIYQGQIRGGEAREAKFAQEKIGNQAFFVYFLVTPKLIAARGKGGGLALWRRAEEQER